jgi:hypothetical protein
MLLELHVLELFLDKSFETGSLIKSNYNFAQHDVTPSRAGADPTEMTSWVGTTTGAVQTQKHARS